MLDRPLEAAERTIRRDRRRIVGGVVVIERSSQLHVALLLEQRVELGMTLRALDVDSVPINFLNPVPGTRLESVQQLTPMDCLRVITLFRYLLPGKRITVCGGRETNLRELQSWIFMAGASGTMVGNYLTTSGRNRVTDLQMFCDIEVSINECK